MCSGFVARAVLRIVWNLSLSLQLRITREQVRFTEKAVPQFCENITLVKNECRSSRGCIPVRRKCLCCGKCGQVLWTSTMLCSFWHTIE